MAVNLHVDISDALNAIEYAKSVLSKDAANEVLRRTMNDAGRKVKSIAGKEIPQDYHVTSSWVTKQVGWPQPLGGAQIGVRIPIKGPRAVIGGGQFSASGGAHGWNSVRRGRYKIKAKIVKSETSVLPARMDHQSSVGNAPFRNLGSKLGKVTFVRQGKKRFPIVRVTGLSVAQMPMNRSRDDMEHEIQRVVEDRLVHHFKRLWG